MKKLCILSTVWLVLALAGCKTDFDNLEFEDWKPIAAIPLVSSEITVDDVLTELNHPEEVLILESGVIALNYKGELFSFTPEELLGLPNQMTSEVYEIGSTEADAVDNSMGLELEFPLNVPFPITVEPEDIRIDEVVLESGNLEISFTRLQDENVSAQLEIAELTDEDGAALAITLTGQNAVGVAEVINVDLAGYSLAPTFIPPNIHRVNLDGIITVTDNTMNTAEAGDFIEFELDFSNLSYTQIFGDFGNISISADVDTIEVNLFENIQGGQFTLNEAIFNLNVTNSFGIPSLVELGEVVSINQNTGEETPLFLEDINLSGQSDVDGPPEMEVFTFNNSNSQVATLFEPAPKLVVFNLSTVSNPDGEPAPDNPNFITNESALDIDIDLILPLEGFAQDLVVFDTIPAEFSFNDYQEIDSLEFRLYTENSFPLDIAFQAYFLNESGLLIDSLFLGETQIIAAASINSEGDVTTSTEQVSFFTLDQERSINLENSTDVIFRAVFNTANSNSNQAVRIKIEQEVDINLGVKIFGNIEL